MNAALYFFNPRSIAIIGATADPKKFGNAVTKNILENKVLQCEIYLITQNSEDIQGKKCYRFLSEVPGEVDLVIILVPARIVEIVINQCIKKKVKGIIIITAGFGEIDDIGKRVEQEIVRKCKENGIRVMGPNCVGIQNLEMGLNASFIQTAPGGSIGMISQSGSIGCACFYEMQEWNLGCSKFASIGNNVDFSYFELLEYLKEDEHTRLISIYMESIKNPKEFLKVLRLLTPVKPVISLKGGKNAIGMQTASSHTGSLASDNRILKAALHQVGTIPCDTIGEFITAMKTFSYLPLPKGEKIGILTNSGGTAVLFCDHLERFNLQLASFSAEFIDKITPHVIPLVKKVNPLDMIAGAGEKEYFEITRAMLEDPTIDIIVVGLVIPPFLEMDPGEHFKGAVKAWNQTGREKPLLILNLFGEHFSGIKQISKEEKITFFTNPLDVALSIKFLIERMKFLNHLNEIEP